MKRVIVQYKVKADQADENRRLIEAVFESLQEASPENLRYASFVKDDGVSFVHIASIETADGSNPLEEIAAFDSFTEAIGDRCEVPPQVAVLEVVGSYQLLGD